MHQRRSSTSGVFLQSTLDLGVGGASFSGLGLGFARSRVGFSFAGVFIAWSPVPQVFATLIPASATAIAWSFSSSSVRSSPILSRFAIGSSSLSSSWGLLSRRNASESASLAVSVGVMRSLRKCSAECCCWEEKVEFWELLAVWIRDGGSAALVEGEAGRGDIGGGTLRPLGDG